MMKALRRGGVAAVIVALVSLVAQTGAYASPNGGALLLAGNGSFGTGLSTTPTVQAVNWAGQAVGALFAGTGTSAGSYQCTFQGNITGSLLTATANLNGNCTGGQLGSSTMSCSIMWTQVGTIIIWTWFCPISTTGPLGAGAGTSQVFGVATIAGALNGDSVKNFAIEGVGGLLGAN